MPVPKRSHHKSSNLSHHLWRSVKAGIVAIFLGLCKVGTCFRTWLAKAPWLIFWSLVVGLIEVIIVVLLVLPGTSVFEGDLTVRSMSFTYTGDIERALINTITDLKKIDITGAQPESFPLTGKFSSPSNPILDAQLQGLSELTLELKNTDSQLIFEAAIASSELAVTELSINKDTKVSELSRPHSNQLNLCLESVILVEGKEANTCRQGQLAESIPVNPVELGLLNVKLGIQPLKVTVYRSIVPELSQVTDTRLTFQFVPSQETELSLPVLSPTRLALELPKITSSAATQAGTISTEDARDWLSQILSVRNVKFSTIPITDTVDEPPVSTVLAGKVRVGQEVINLQEGQFLVVEAPDPGIDTLRYLKIHPTVSTGIRVFVSGESQSIGVGLDEDSPVQSLQFSQLSKHLSQEASNALLSFFSALLGFVLPLTLSKLTDTQ